MGSHFSQCFASHQTIAPGDKCYALAIRQQGSYDTVHMTHHGKPHELQGISHGAIWPDAYWTTVGNFIEGVYRISGDIDITENDENTRRLLVFVRLMLENAAVVAEGENPVHDLPFNLPQYLADHTPFLKAYLEQTPAPSLSPAESSQLFKELAAVWTHADDVAFKHRVFYADYAGRMRPLQFTLMHRRCYEELLGQVKESHSAPALFDKCLAHAEAVPSLTAALPAGLPAELVEMYDSMAARSFVEPLRQLGQFDSIAYYEEQLGVGQFVRGYLAGKLTRAALLKRVVLVLNDRLVMHLLENYKLKLTPKCIWHEDGSNEFGRDYAEFVGRVSAGVTRSRKNKPKTY